MATYENRSLERGFTIVQCLREAQRPMTLVEIAEKIGMNRPTTFRLLSVLCRHGYAHKNEAKTSYSLGEQIFASVPRNKLLGHITKIARPVMRRLVVEQPFAVRLSQRVGAHVVICDTGLPAKLAPRMTTGAYCDAHASADGKVLLANSSPREIAQLYAHVPLTGHTPHTVRSLVTLCRELRNIYDNGFAIDDQESDIAIRSIAAPVTFGSNRALYAVTLLGFAQELKGERLTSALSSLTSAAAEITAALRLSTSRQTFSGQNSDSHRSVAA